MQELSIHSNQKEMTIEKHSKFRICLIGQNIHIQSRNSDTGLLWPLAKGLSQKGHEVVIISSSSPLKKYELTRDNVKAFYLQDGSSPFKNLKLVDAIHRKFTQLHNENPFDLVHSVDQSGFKIGKHKKNFQILMAYDVQAIHLSDLFATLAEDDGSLFSQISTYFKLIWKFINNYLATDRSLLSTADGIFVTTPQQRLILERYFLYPDFHTYTVPYGINLGNLTTRLESETFKLKNNFPENSKLILATTDFVNAMEVSPLLKAFEKIISKHDHIYLILVGDGPKWKEVEFMMLSRVLGSKVIMPKDLIAEELLDYIAASSVYVDLSSRSTGLEPSLIEAMAQKKIVIGSELSPIAEIIEDHIDGFLVRPADDRTIFHLLDQILENESAYLKMGEAAREKVINFFNKDKMLLALIRAYEQIIHKSASFKRRKMLKKAD